MVRFIFLFVLVLILSPLVASAADPQTGGLPDVAARVTTLETLVTTLQTNVRNLQTNVTTLQTNVTALQSANSGLQNALNAEIAARTGADTTLKSALDNEILQRKAYDASLDLMLSQEKNARVNQDQYLYSLIDAIDASEKKTFSTYVGSTFLPYGNMTTVATLGPIPPANYFVTGKAVVANSDHDASWYCALHINGDLFEQALAHTESRGTFANNSVATIVLENIVNLTVPGTITIDCETHQPGSDMSLISLIAIQVGSPG